jgi:hypothetical protein
VELVREIEQALSGLAKSGAVEVQENGRRLAGQEVHFEVRAENSALVIHLWSDAESVVRRVVGIAERSGECVVLEVRRFGYTRPARLEFRIAGRERPAEQQIARARRADFLTRFSQLLRDKFPDETLDSLSARDDLEHSLSDCYARGLMHRGSEAWAVVGVSGGESAATIDATLTAGLLWFDGARDSGAARTRTVAGLRLFLPKGAAHVTAHRMAALVSSLRVELYELDELHGEARRRESGDASNVATRLIPRREAESLLAAAGPGVEPIVRLAPQAIRLGVAADGKSVALRFRGLQFASWEAMGITFGLGDQTQPLTAASRPRLEKLVRDLETHRNPLATDVKHRLYRAQAERWLETLVQEDPGRVDPRLDPQHIYSQVPAVSGRERGILDLLGVTRDGRLAILELKADEELHLVLQAADYWLRVRRYQERDDFRRHGYFQGIELQELPPRVYLVAPALRFHPANARLLRYMTREMEVIRVGVQENWRRGLRVSLRQ